MIRSRRGYTVCLMNASDTDDGVCDDCMAEMMDDGNSTSMFMVESWN